MPKKKKPVPFTADEEAYIRKESARSFRGGPFDRAAFTEMNRLYKKNEEEYARITREVKAGIVDEIRGMFGG